MLEGITGEGRDELERASGAVDAAVSTQGLPTQVPTRDPSTLRAPLPTVANPPKPQGTASQPAGMLVPLNSVPDRRGQDQFAIAGS